ncbi:PaaI family thioesterase [Flavisphingomonas formosensis]|uniref:PaaI family thioesterase n=1 Tax=Flavisphingomonas formosensis TaxID=861534 RepID=UPI0012F7CD08|nr:PaaI family thioesterase [Sphingomonas formosensis]
MAELPPYAKLLGVRLDHEHGQPLLVLPHASHLIGRPGFMHGGAIAGLLELAGFAAIRHALGGSDGPRIKPINVTVDYMRGGRLIETRAAARVTRLGRRVANVEAEAWQEDRGKLIATAKLNLMLDRG